MCGNSIHNAKPYPAINLFISFFRLTGPVICSQTCGLIWFSSRGRSGKTENSRTAFIENSQLTYLKIGLKRFQPRAAPRFWRWGQTIQRAKLNCWPPMTLSLVRVMGVYLSPSSMVAPPLFPAGVLFAIYFRWMPFSEIPCYLNILPIIS
jgi:hypothetical protein